MKCGLKVKQFMYHICNNNIQFAKVMNKVIFPCVTKYSICVCYFYMLLSELISTGYCHILYSYVIFIWSRLIFSCVITTYVILICDFHILVLFVVSMLFLYVTIIYCFHMLFRYIISICYFFISFSYITLIY